VPPVPDDVAQEREDGAAYRAEHKAALPLSELPLAEIKDDRLARVLGELRGAVEARARMTQECESAKRTEAQPNALGSE
jgi:hypothetical protein